MAANVHSTICRSAQNTSSPPPRASAVTSTTATVAGLTCDGADQGGAHHRPVSDVPKPPSPSRTPSPRDPRPHASRTSWAQIALGAPRTVGSASVLILPRASGSRCSPAVVEQFQSPHLALGSLSFVRIIRTAVVQGAAVADSRWGDCHGDR